MSKNNLSSSALAQNYSSSHSNGGTPQSSNYAQSLVKPLNRMLSFVHQPFVLFWAQNLTKIFFAWQEALTSMRTPDSSPIELLGHFVKSCVTISKSLRRVALWPVRVFIELSPLLITRLVRGWSVWTIQVWLTQPWHRSSIWTWYVGTLGALSLSCS